MKVIFLDFDGVLNSIRTVYAYPLMTDRFNECWEQLDPIAVMLTRRLCEEHDAKIVISSTWRKLFTIEEFKQKFLELYNWDIPIIDMTASSSRGFRGEEINDWLEDNQHVCKYVILDDDSDFYMDQPFVKVNGLHGISVFDYHRAVLCLDPGNKKSMRFIDSHSDYE